MVDMTAIMGLTTSLRAIVDITKAMKDVHDANLIQSKIFELTRESWPPSRAHWRSKRRNLLC
jgi:hypothetical protein